MKSKSVKLTKEFIDSLQYQGKSNSPFIVFDTEMRRFGIRVYPSGSKAFIISYRFKGKQFRMTLGYLGNITLREARALAHDNLHLVCKGENPLEKRRQERKGDLFEQLAQAYIEQHSKKEKRSWSEDERRLRMHILPAIGKKRIVDVSQEHIKKIRNSIGETHQVEANRVLSLLHAIFEWARREKFGVASNHTNPAHDVDKFHEQSKDRWVKPHELPQLLTAINNEPNVYVQAALKLYLLTGLRKSELLEAKWEHVDFNRCEIEIPETKSGKKHTLPLSSPAIEILRNLPRELDNPFIICGYKKGHHLVNIREPWLRVRQEAGLLDVTLHDLRRTVGSMLATSGESLLLIGKVLNHSNQSTTQIYSRLQNDPVKEALEKLGEKIIRMEHIQEQAKQTA